MRESRTYGSGRGACHEMHVPTATTPRVHHVAWRRGGVAALGARSSRPFPRSDSSAAARPIPKSCCYLSFAKAWRKKASQSAGSAGCRHRWRLATAVPRLRASTARTPPFLVLDVLCHTPHCGFCGVDIAGRINGDPLSHGSIGRIGLVRRHEGRHLTPSHGMRPFRPSDRAWRTWPVYRASLRLAALLPAEQRDELAAMDHSITSSARARSDCGTVRRSALAVIRFTTRLNLVGCSTGISAGLVPRRILST